MTTNGPSNYGTDESQTCVYATRHDAYLTATTDDGERTDGRQQTTTTWVTVMDSNASPVGIIYYWYFDDGRLDKWYV